MDFGPSARDYAEHRKGFPDSVFERFPLSGDVLDLGAGTGSVGRGYAARGARVVALDLSPAMLREARGLPLRIAARAESLPLRDESFDAVAAGQCWHWFDGPRTARECARVVRPGGILAMLHFDYLPLPGTAAAAAEALILAENPRWEYAGIDARAGRYDRWRPQLDAAGFEDVRTLDWEVDVEYTHEAWRGRMRACNGALTLPDLAARARVDLGLQRVLAAEFPPIVRVPHRVFIIWGRKP